MPPEVRRSQEQIGNLPGVQTTYVADTTATAKAAIQIGRDLQNNQVFAAIGSMFEQKERRNVEDAYMRLQAANNAHLNGGAYTLTGDPLDTEEGGGFLTKRGKNAEGSDEAFRSAMQKDADRLTAKMNTNERLQFSKLFSHVTENGLASLRRHTDQEMLRATSELVDSTLQSAAASNLSTAINTYAGQSAFNGGALAQAERQAGATGDSKALAGAQTAIAQQSQTQAVGAVNDWYNANVMEIDRAADFMRSQGMDEKAIAWRKQEFLQRQGVSMAETLTAQGLYDHADNFLANAEKVGLNDKEAIGKLRMSNERMRNAHVEKQNRLADEKYKTDRLTIAKMRIDDPTGITQRPQEYKAKLQLMGQGTTDYRIAEHLAQEIDRVDDMERAIANQKAAAHEKRTDKAGKFSAEADMNQLIAGFRLDENNNPVYMHPAEIEEIASVLMRKTNQDGTPHPTAITQTQYEEIVKNANGQRDQRTEQFHQRVSMDVLGKFKEPLMIQRYPGEGKQIQPEAFALNPKEKGLLPVTTTQFKNDYKTAAGKSQREAITAATLVQFMNVVNQQMRYDKTMTPDAAYLKFTELTKGTLRGYEDATAADSLSEQSALLTKLRDTHNRKMQLGKPIITK